VGGEGVVGAGGAQPPYGVGTEGLGPDGAWAGGDGADGIAAGASGDLAGFGGATSPMDGGEGEEEEEEEDDGPVVRGPKRGRKDAGAAGGPALPSTAAATTAGAPAAEDESSAAGVVTGGKRRRGGATAGVAASTVKVGPPAPTPSVAPTKPAPAASSAKSFAVVKPPLSSLGQQLLAADRSTFLPPAYVGGVRDQHLMLLLHPVEVWADPAGGAGVLDEAVRAGWNQALSAGVSSTYSSTTAPKVSYRDLTSKSWGNTGRGSSAGASASIAAESHLRWSRSVMHHRPAAEGVEMSSAAAAAATAAAARAKAAAEATDGTFRPLIPLTPAVGAPPAGVPGSSSTSASGVSPLGQVAVLLAASAAAAADAAATSANPSPLARLPPSLGLPVAATILGPGGEPTAAVAAPIVTQALGDGPRSAYHETLTHGVVVHAGLRVSPLDVIAEALSETTRWSAAAITLADAVTESVAHGIQREQRARKEAKKAVEKEKRRLARRQTRGMTGDTDTEDEEEDEEEEDEDDDELPLETFGTGGVGEIGRLWRPPYAAYASSALQERLLATTLLLCLAAADAAAAVLEHPAGTRPLPASLASLADVLRGGARPVVTPLALSALLSASAGDALFAKARGACMSLTGGLGPRALAVRLQALADAGLAELGAGGEGAAAADELRAPFALSPAGRAGLLSALERVGASATAAGKDTGGKARASKPQHATAVSVSATAPGGVDLASALLAADVGQAAHAADLACLDAASGPRGASVSFALPTRVAKPWRG
jgi:hypothetical protein